MSHVRMGLLFDSPRSKVTALMSTKKLSKELLRAVEACQVELVQQLLAQGAKPDGARGWGGSPVLSCALFSVREQQPTPTDVEAGAAKIIAMLLAAGANPLAPGTVHAVSTAAGMENTSILRMLLEAGASGAEQETPHETVSPLEVAIRHDRRAAVECLLEHGVSPNDRISIPWTSRTQYPLWYAIEKKASAALVRVLLDRGADPDAVDDRYRTAQWLAYTHERPDLLQLLCQRGRALRGQLGLAFYDEPADAEQYLASQGLASGVPVRLVGRDSAAERAGMRRGDVVLRIDGAPVNAPSDFPRREAFSVMKVDWSREGLTLSAAIELGPAGPYGFGQPGMTLP